MRSRHTEDSEDRQEIEQVFMNLLETMIDYVL
jgi:hypothetical protein